VTTRAHNLYGAGAGILFVLLELVGFGLGGSTHQLTVTSSTAEVANAIANTATTASWIGAYLDILGYGAFLVFAVWAAATMGGGTIGSLTRATATSYATLSIASLAVIDAIAYRAGHHLTVQLAQALSTINEALFVTTWFVMAFFQLATGVLALRQARRTIGWSAVATACFTLIATAISINTLGQLSTLLFFAWVISASLALGRRPVAAEIGVAITQ
jgi:hypothetical protein